MMDAQVERPRVGKVPGVSGASYALRLIRVFGATEYPETSLVLQRRAFQEIKGRALF